jgi:hypothetical protein
LDSFRAKDPDGFDAGAFRRIREFTQNIEAQVKNATTKEEVEAPFKEYPGVGGLIDAVKIADKNLRSLASELNEVENHPNATQEFKTKILNRMRELQKYHYAQTVNIAIKLGFDNQVYDF